jgi:Family of unknown function (DUF5709)
MAGEQRHETDNLGDYEVLDGSETLDGVPGDDPLDRGLVPPSRWSAGMRSDSTTANKDESESLDQLLAEEEPEAGSDLDEASADEDWDENATEDDVARLDLDDSPDPRAGRLVAEEEGSDGAGTADLVAHDSGIDGGGAAAEEAAVHVVTDEEA